MTRRARSAAGRAWLGAGKCRSSEEGGTYRSSQLCVCVGVRERERESVCVDLYWVRYDRVRTEGGSGAWQGSRWRAGLERARRGQRAIRKWR